MQEPHVKRALSTSSGLIRIEMWSCMSIVVSWYFVVLIWVNRQLSTVLSIVLAQAKLTIPVIMIDNNSCCKSNFVLRSNSRSYRSYSISKHVCGVSGCELVVKAFARLMNGRIMQLWVKQNSNSTNYLAKYLSTYLTYFLLLSAIFAKSIICIFHLKTEIRLLTS